MKSFVVAMIASQKLIWKGECRICSVSGLYWSCDGCLSGMRGGFV